MKKILLIYFAFTLFCTSNVIAQLINGVTYRFNGANTSTAAVTPVIPYLIGSGADNAVSLVTDIGFDFWFAGTLYTQFSVTEDGLMKLGSTAIVPEPVNSIASGTNLPKIAPYWDDLATGSNGYVGYQLTGTAPSRILRVKWFVAIPKTNATANAMFQAELYEASGNIHFAYGATLPPANGAGYTVGLGVSATDWVNLAPTGSTFATVSYGITAYDNNTGVPAGPSVKRYQFGTDYTAPAFPTVSAIPNTFGTGNRTLTARITDLTPYNGTGVPLSGSLVPRVYYKRATDISWVSTPGVNQTGTGIDGTWLFTVDHSLLSGGGAVPGDQIQYFIIAQDQSVALGHPNISSYPAGVVATDVNTITTPPSAPLLYLIGADFSGTITVGTGGDYSSLTLAGGLFDQINAGQLSGNLTVNIISDLTVETGLKGLNAWVNGAGGPFTLTINPVGHRIVSGINVNGGTPNVISLIGATGVTIDGLNDGTNSLTIIQTGQYYVGSVVDLKGASGNTITNVAINGYGASNYAISITNSTAASNNNTISYCTITNPVNSATKAGNGIGLLGTSTLAGDHNIITHNIVSNYTYFEINISGKFSNTEISNNEIFNSLPTAWHNNFKGIVIGTAVTGTTNTFNNKIYDLTLDIAAQGGSVPAIYSSGAAGTISNIYNNVIYLDASFTHPSQIWNGIQTAGAGAVNIYYNSIFIGGTNITAGSSYGINKGGSGATNILNNVVFNARSNSSGTGKHYGIYTTSPATLTSNFNDIYTNGTGGYFGFNGADRLTLTDWQTATSMDANSLSVDPQFTSATNLLPLNMALNAGTPVATITTDILALSRHATTPTIGAYELPKPACLNPSDGGTITSDQTGCYPFDPATFKNSSAPSGYFGTLEYKWQLSTTSSITGFTDIPTSNADSLDIGPIIVTTWYKRLVRVDCVADWTGAVESNVVMVTVNNCDMTLNLSGIFLEGLYISGGTMNQARDAAGLRWPAGVADHITVELHDAANYSVIVFTASNVPLSTSGTASVTVPAAFNGSYFITIRHHNSIETTSATAVSFISSTISQSFGIPADVFGGNLGLSTDGQYFIYGGDVNQNGLLESFDMTPIDNLSSSFGYGLAEDVNCDGLIDSRDMTIVDNNSSAFVSSTHP